VKLCILGGSSPFTAAMFDAASRAVSLNAFDTIVLHGRNVQALERMAAYAADLDPSRRRVYQAEPNIDRALRGCDVVLAQVRVGGLEHRQRVEEVCDRLGLFADETLGIGGLATAIHCRSSWDAIGESIGRLAPNALVLNMINPLSLSSVRLARSGVQVVGLCEGPLCTVADVARHMGIEASDVEWRYSGLNHRGIVHSLGVGGTPVAPSLLEDYRPLSKLPAYAPEVEGIMSKELVLAGQRARWSYGRAQEVATVRSSLARELTETSAIADESLKRRPTPWYADAVLPFLSAWSGASPPWRSTANQQQAEIFVERRVDVSCSKVRATSDEPPNTYARQLLAALLAHEEACVNAVDRGTRSAVREALALDPLLRGEDLESATCGVAELTDIH
jgi:6-phospho-beta-glucosidase